MKKEVYRETLPPECPLPHAEPIKKEMTVYRLVNNNPAGPLDFRSKKAMQPSGNHVGCECHLHGLSVFTSEVVCRSKILPGRRSLVCAVKLNNGAGRIAKTNGESHYTWWPYVDYDILSCCDIVAL